MIKVTAVARTLIGTYSTLSDHVSGIAPPMATPSRNRTTSNSQ
jgi:hypothetical protein